MEKLRLSSSAIACFQECNLKFKLAYIDKIQPKVKGNIYSSFGSSIHLALRKFYEKKDFKESSIMENWPALFKNDLLINNIQVPGFKMEEFSTLGSTILSKFYERQKKDGFLIDPLFIEKKYVHEFPEFKVVAIIDVGFEKDNKIEIVDYKTSSKIKNEKEIDCDIQLTLYAWMFWKKHSYLPDGLCLYYLRNSKKVFTQRTIDELKAFEDFLINFYNIISKVEEWIPSFENCNRCDFQDNCSSFQSKKIRIM